MKIAVTGANGFVGRVVLGQLAQARHTSLPLVRRACGLPGEMVIGNLTDGGVAADDLAGCDAVIHLAARTHVMNETASDPIKEYRRTNVDGTARLLDAALAARIGRFVFMSSIKAVGEWSLPGEPLQPDTSPRPEDAYGKSKLEAEALVRERCQAAGVSWAILRPPLVYGPGVKANFEWLISWVARGIPLPFGAIDNRRSLVDVRNLADAAVLAAISTKGQNQAYMVADATVSTPDLVRAIGKAVGRPTRLLPVPPALLGFAGTLSGKKDMMDRLCGSLELDSTRTTEALGWLPQRSFEESLGEIAVEKGYGSGAMTKETPE